MSLRRLALLLLPVSALTYGASFTLYNGALGSAPDAQGWTFGSNGAATVNVENLDTTGNIPTKAGYSMFAPVSLSTATGFRYSFDVRVNSETHNTNDRAGFSVIVLTSSLAGIELGFWADTVFAQNTAFTHGEDQAFVTTAMTHYDLDVHGTTYSLSENSNFLMSGALRNYSGFGLPYNLPNFLFVGDDTSSAGANIDLQSVTLGQPAPEPGAFVLLASGLAAVFVRRKMTSRSGSRCLGFARPAGPNS